MLRACSAPSFRGGVFSFPNGAQTDETVAVILQEAKAGFTRTTLCVDGEWSR